MHGVASLSLISSRVAGLSQTSRLCLGALTLALATAFTADADASVIGFAADSANVITTSYAVLIGRTPMGALPGSTART